jgi:hypothetical protein
VQQNQEASNKTPEFVPDYGEGISSYGVGHSLGDQSVWRIRDPAIGVCVSAGEVLVQSGRGNMHGWTNDINSSKIE